jgi:hypothetical protein
MHLVETIEHRIRHAVEPVLKYNAGRVREVFAEHKRIAGLSMAAGAQNEMRPV